MSSKKFSEAMSELDSKYVDEAINYKKKARKPGWIKWGAIAACLCFVICAFAIPLLFDDGNIPGPSAGDLAPMIYVNDTLYKQSASQTSFNEMKDDFVYLGIIESEVDASQKPTENFQANDGIVGAKVYQYGEDIVVLINDDYWLYSIIESSQPAKASS